MAFPAAWQAPLVTVPRFAIAIIEERDLAGMDDLKAQLDRVVGRLLERRPEIRTLFLVGSCPSEVIKLDLALAARRLASNRPGVRILSYSGSGIETTSTEGEDACPATLVPEMPEGGASDLIVAGGLPDIVKDQFARLFEELGITAHFFPGRSAGALPAVGPGTRVLLAQPFLGETMRALEARGAVRLPAPFPFDAEVEAVHTRRVRPIARRDVRPRRTGT